MGLQEGLRDDSRRLIMLWSPRAGCTVSCKMFFEHMGLLDDANRYSNWIHDYRIRHFYPKFGKTNAQILRQYLVFKTIVNPFQRAVSCYHQYCRGKMERGRHNVTFEQYLKLLIRGQFYDPRAIYHSRQQYVKGEEQYVNRYIKLEGGQRTIDQKLNKPFGFNLKIGDKSSQHHVKKRAYQRFLGHTPFNAIQILPVSYRCFYNKQIIDLVKRCFPDDVKRYGYKFRDLK